MGADTKSSSWGADTFPPKLGRTFLRTLFRLKGGIGVDTYTCLTGFLEGLCGIVTLLCMLQFWDNAELFPIGPPHVFKAFERREVDSSRWNPDHTQDTEHKPQHRLISPTSQRSFPSKITVYKFIILILLHDRDTASRSA